MRTLIAATAVALLAGLPAAAEPDIALPGGSPVKVHGPQAVAKSVIAAELAFEARAEAAGPPSAMREFMDPADGLSFAGGEPARGAAAIYLAHGGDKPAGKLSWVPTEVFADSAGEMAATWGHFRFVPPVAGAKTVTGRYVTVWRKRDGQWRGIIDIGDPD
jgi:ketosteroid isomerase-like protein